MFYRMKGKAMETEFDPVLWGAAVGVIVLTVWAVFAKPAPAATGTAVRSGFLDQALFWWTPRDPLSRRDLLDGGGICILGRPGAGKSSSSGYQLGLALAADRKVGGIIIASKPEDKGMWQAIFARVGRPHDLLIFESGGPLRCNFLEEELRQGADTPELVQCILTIAETLGRQQRRGGGNNEQFWQSLKERGLWNAVEIVKWATGTVRAADLQKFMTGAAGNAALLKDETWRAGTHRSWLKKSYETPKSEVQQADVSQAVSFWMDEYPYMDAKVRSSSFADIVNVLHVFNTGLVRQLVGSETNISPSVVDESKFLLVNAPLANYGASGAVISAGWKYLIERHVLRRHASDDCPLAVVWSDEFQRQFNGFDSTFIAEARSHRGALIALTQSLHSFEGAVAGEEGKSRAHELLACFGTKIVHALGDDHSAEWAAALCGRELQNFSGMSMQPVESIYDELMDNHRGISISASQRHELCVQHREFMHGLRTGGPQNGNVCDAYVIRSGMPFSSTGRNFIKVGFLQPEKGA